MHLADFTSKRNRCPIAVLALALSIASCAFTLPTATFTLRPPSLSEEWRRWAETEVNKQRRRVLDKRVGIIRTLIEYVNPGSTGSGQGGTNVDIGKGEESVDESEFSYAFRALAANKLV